MSREERLAAIKELQQVRGNSHVIAYLTSTRPGAESQMQMDAIRPIYDHLTALPKVGKRKVDLFIHSNGGDTSFPWRLVTLIRDFADEFHVLVPYRAFSAATLAALGADSVVMHPMGMLGPTDPTVTNQFNPPNPVAPGQFLGISVEDVASYLALVKEDVGIQHEDELIHALIALTNQVHPLALGNVKRFTLQSRMMGEKLLHRRVSGDLADHTISNIVRKLGSELYFHGHPINAREAREDVGLSFVQDATEGEAAAMWRLFEVFEADMELRTEFMPVLEAAAMNPLQVPSAPAAPAVVTLPTQLAVVIESVSRCDVYERDLEVVLSRDANGIYNGSLNLVRQGWVSR